MQPIKGNDSLPTILNGTDTLNKSRELNSSSISQKMTAYNRPPSYTFYQPTHSYSNVTPNLNKSYQKKEYHFVSECFGGNRLSGFRPATNLSLDKQSNQKQEKGYGYKILNSALKFDTPQARNKQESNYFSAKSAVNSSFSIEKNPTDYSQIEVKKISSYQYKKQPATPIMFQSTIILQKSGVSEDKSKSPSKHLTEFSNLQSSIVVQSNVSLASLSHNELVVKLQALQLKQKDLQNRNYNLAQQLLSNQSLNRKYEQKCQELHQTVQKYKKSQQSLKISRNIISTLNQKIIRTSKENEASIKSLQQKYQIQILDLKHQHEEESKKLQSTIFELKLKVIDQTNAMEQALAKAEEKFKSNSNRQLLLCQNEINDLRNVAGLNQNEIRRLNQVIINLESDIMKLDEVNMKMDQQIAKLLAQNGNSEGIITSLRQQIQTLVQQISQTHLLFQELKAQNLQLKHKQQQLAFNKEKTTNTHSNDEQKGFLMSNISNYEGQIKNLMQSIEKFKNQVKQLRSQKDDLLQQLQEKEGEIAKLNITKGSLMLQNLKFKEKAKKTSSHEFITAQQDVQLQEITNLKSQIAQLKAQIQIYKEQNKQKDLILQEKEKGLNYFKQLLKKREQEIKKLTEQYLIKTEQQLTLINKTQQDWSNRYEGLQKQLEASIQKCRNLQTIYLQQRNRDKQQNKQKLEQKQQKIQLLFQQLEKSSQHIEHQTTQIINLRQQKTFSQEKGKLLKQLEILNSQLKYKLIEQNQNHQLAKIQLNQTIQNQNVSIKQLQQNFQTQKIQPGTVQSLQGQQKQSLFSFQSQKIAELQLQLKKSLEIIQQQKFTIQELKNQLQIQQKDYRTMVQQQINKITMIYSEQNNELDSPLKPNLARVALQPQQSIEQDQQEESERQSHSIQLQNMSRADLINKIRQLQFINNSLELKVQQINNMQQNLNDVIIDKLRTFEVNLQKNQQQKHQLQEKVSQLTIQLQAMVEKCQHYQNKIQWVDVMYKEVQSNLSDTIEELIKTQALYFNLKLQVQNSQLILNIQAQEEQNLNIVHKQVQFVEIQQNKEQKFAKKQNIDVIQSHIQATQVIVIQQVKKKTAQNQNEQVNQMMEEDPLANYEISDKELEVSQLNYYVKEAKHGDTVYQIIVSQVQSQSQEQQFQKQQESDDDILQHWEETDEQLDERMFKMEMKKTQQVPQQRHSHNQFSNFIMNTIQKLQQTEQQKVDPQPEKTIVQDHQYQPENLFSNYLMGMIKTLEAKQNKKIAEQKKKKEQFFKTFQQQEMLQKQQLFKQEIEMQQTNNHS